MTGNIFDTNYISNRIKLKIELNDSPRKILSEIENYLDKIFLALNKSEHSFTKEELENNLKSTFNINDKLFIRKINNFILTYTSLATPNYDSKNDNFLIIKKILKMEKINTLCTLQSLINLKVKLSQNIQKCLT